MLFFMRLRSAYPLPLIYYLLTLSRVDTPRCSRLVGHALPLLMSLSTCNWEWQQQFAFFLLTIHSTLSIYPIQSINFRHSPALQCKETERHRFFFVQFYVSCYEINLWNMSSSTHKEFTIHLYENIHSNVLNRKALSKYILIVCACAPCWREHSVNEPKSAGNGWTKRRRQRQMTETLCVCVYSFVHLFHWPAAKPQSAYTHILDKSVRTLILFSGLCVSLLLFGCFFWHISTAQHIHTHSTHDTINIYCIYNTFGY